MDSTGITQAGRYTKIKSHPVIDFPYLTWNEDKYLFSINNESWQEIRNNVVPFRKEKGSSHYWSQGVHVKGAGKGLMFTACNSVMLGTYDVTYPLEREFEFIADCMEVLPKQVHSMSWYLSPNEAMIYILSEVQPYKNGPYLLLYAMLRTIDGKYREGVRKNLVADARHTVSVKADVIKQADKLSRSKEQKYLKDGTVLTLTPEHAEMPGSIWNSDSVFWHDEAVTVPFFADQLAMLLPLASGGYLTLRASEVTKGWEASNGNGSRVVVAPVIVKE